MLGRVFPGASRRGQPISHLDFSSYRPISDPSLPEMWDEFMKISYRRNRKLMH
jgi:hypothetical protein